MNSTYFFEAMFEREFSVTTDSLSLENSLSKTARVSVGFPEFGMDVFSSSQSVSSSGIALLENTLEWNLGSSKSGISLGRRVEMTVSTSGDFWVAESSSEWTAQLGQLTSEYSTSSTVLDWGTNPAGVQNLLPELSVSSTEWDWGMGRNSMSLSTQTVTTGNGFEIRDSNLEFESSLGTIQLSQLTGTAGNSEFQMNSMSFESDENLMPLNQGLPDPTASPLQQLGNPGVSLDFVSSQNVFGTDLNMNAQSTEIQFGAQSIQHRSQTLDVAFGFAGPETTLGIEVNQLQVDSTMALFS